MRFKIFFFKVVVKGEMAGENTAVCSLPLMPCCCLSYVGGKGSLFDNSIHNSMVYR